MAVRQLGIYASRGQQLVKLQLGSSAESYSSNIGNSTAWQLFICMLTGAEEMNRGFVLFAGSIGIRPINVVSKSIRAYLPPGMDKISAFSGMEDRVRREEERRTEDGWYSCMQTAVFLS